MAETLTLDLLVRAEWLLQDGDAIQRPSERGLIGEVPQNFASGTGDFQVAKRWASVRTLAGAASETLDLTDLDDVAFASIKLILVWMTKRVARLKVGGTVANEFFGPWGATGRGQEIGMGSAFVASDFEEGWAVISTEKALLLTNLTADEDAEFQILIAGT